MKRQNVLWRWDFLKWIIAWFGRRFVSFNFSFSVGMDFSSFEYNKNQLSKHWIHYAGYFHSSFDINNPLSCFDNPFISDWGNAIMFNAAPTSFSCEGTFSNQHCDSVECKFAILSRVVFWIRSSIFILFSFVLAFLRSWLSTSNFYVWQNNVSNTRVLRANKKFELFPSQKTVSMLFVTIEGCVQ